MSSIISKKFKGNTYYYVVESARVGGKPRIVSQRYLGKASDIEAAMAGAQVLPERTRHLGFGDLAAALSVLRRLGVAQIIDAIVGPRPRRCHGERRHLRRADGGQPGGRTVLEAGLL